MTPTKEDIRSTRITRCERQSFHVTSDYAALLVVGKTLYLGDNKYMYCSNETWVDWHGNTYSLYEFLCKLLESEHLPYIIYED